jgi:hypothetical protein
MDSSTTNTTAVSDNQVISDAEFDQSFGDIARRWKAQNAEDLEIRHQVGDLLNKRFGSPGNRQKRGAEVLKKAAAELDISQSEISRMRRFASHFPTFEDFKQRHADATNWSAVKDLLPKVKRKVAASKPRGASHFKKAKQLLKDLSSALAKIPADLPKDQRQALFEKLQEVVRAVNDRLSVQVSVSQVSEPSAPASPTSPVEDDGFPGSAEGGDAGEGLFKSSRRVIFVTPY